MKPTTRNRVFALDLHPLNFGYAMFDGPDELIDWGIRNFRHGVNAVKVPMNVKLVSLLDQLCPDILVMKEPKKEALKGMARAITVLAKRYGISVQTISCASVRRAFPDDSHNKYQVASVIASRYPELAPRLGPRRKLWQAERYSMSIFDAAAIGIAYFTPEARNDNSSDRTLSPLPR